MFTIGFSGNGVAKKETSGDCQQRSLPLRVRPEGAAEGRKLMSAISNVAVMGVRHRSDDFLVPFASITHFREDASMK
jgi:hypothetical protein